MGESPGSGEIVVGGFDQQEKQDVLVEAGEVGGWALAEVVEQTASPSEKMRDNNVACRICSNVNDHSIYLQFRDRVG